MFKNIISYVIINLDKLINFKKRLLEMDKRKRLKIGTSNEVAVTLEALDNPKYKWRTINGIAKETAQKPQIVKQNIDRLIREGIAITASASGPLGEKLYTSKKHYFSKKFTINRFLSVLSDEVK